MARMADGNRARPGKPDRVFLLRLSGKGMAVLDYVINASKSFASHGPPAINNWLKQI
jgi:hypothetical protein